MGLTLPQIQRTKGYQELAPEKQRELIRVYHRASDLDGNSRT